MIIDNLGSQNAKAVRQAIEAVGARLFFLPKYSPDLNPVEQVFAKHKDLLRKLAPRSLPDLESAIAVALTQFSPEECGNYLRHAGYAI